jgi:hypothetical protein
MLPLPGLTGAQRRMFNRALRGVDDNLATSPDFTGDPEGEGTDLEPEPGDPPSTSQPDPGGNPMRVVCANIRVQNTMEQKRADYVKLRDMGSILLLQEIFGGGRAVFGQVFPESQWHHVPSLDRPIGERLALKKAHWDIQQQAVYFASPPPRPGGVGRDFAVALVRLKGTNIQFLVISTHYIAHAWCGHQLSNKAYWRRIWGRHDDRFRALVNDARNKGITVIGGADFNRSISQGRTKFHSTQDWFRTSFLDGLFGVKATGGANYTVGATQRVSMHSDHDALVAQLTWTAGSNPVKTGYNWGGRF